MRLASSSVLPPANHFCSWFLDALHLLHTQALLEENRDFMLPVSRRNEVLGWVKNGLRDFSISRSAVEWGIAVPRDPAQTVYVW